MIAKDDTLYGINNVSDYTGQPGDAIRIRVTDYFMVKEVKVSISRSDGSLVEDGYAAPDAVGYVWTYIAATTNDDMDGNRIEIIASDLPGNIAVEEKIL